MGRIIWPFLVLVLAVLAIAVADLRRQTMSEPVAAFPPPYVPFRAYIEDRALRRMDGAKVALPYRVPGAALDPAYGGEPAPPVEEPPPAIVGVVEMPPGDPHRIVVSRADLYAHLSRPVRVTDRLRLRVDWRDVMLLEVAA